MRELDEQEQKVVRALIKNPRSSDNDIGKKTGVPIRTVSRKRKKLEEERLINYFTMLNMGYDGTGRFGARHLYIVKFKMGLTKERFMKELRQEPHVKSIFLEFIYESTLAEIDGHLALLMVVEGKTDSEITENFNKIILPSLKKNHGEDSVISLNTIRLDTQIRFFHNYLLPDINVEKGRIKEDWQYDSIFVG